MPAPNDEEKVKTLTVRLDGPPDAARRDAVDAVARSHGGRSCWRESARAASRAYALVELPEGAAGAEAALAGGGATVCDSPVIALAVFPTVTEALPLLLTALAGPGRPAGVRSCEPLDDVGVVIEWNLERTPAAIVLGLVDVELRRYNSGRTVELLSPLPAAWIARIASDGLQSPEISSDRVLETLIERAGLHV